MVARFARRMDAMRPSAVREILKVTAQPEVISFAGGLPAPELFPVDDLRGACDRVLRNSGTEALQYGLTEGYAPLREYLVEEMGRRGVKCTAEQILVTSGSQQALDLLARVLLDPGDVVLTENPTYLAAIQIFQSYQANFAPVPTDEEGMVVEALPELIERHHPKMLYLVPNFQNPTGRTMTAERRAQLRAMADRYHLLVVEDDPYGRLRYRGEDIPPVKALGGEDNTVYLSTFSKTVAPGMRVGWAVAPADVRAKMVVAKQASDLQSSSLDQRIVCEYLRTCDSEAHIERIRNAYGERYRLMDEALRKMMPKGYRWTNPDGGMFLWMTCPECLDTLPLLQVTLKHNVAFVPGQDFFPDGSGRNYMRLNFSNSGPERITEGVSRLARACQAAMA